MGIDARVAGVCMDMYILKDECIININYEYMNISTCGCMNMSIYKYIRCTKYATNIVGRWLIGVDDCVAVGDGNVSL